MRILTVLCLLMFCRTAVAQTEFEWDGKYRITLADFQSPATQIGNSNIYSVQPGTGFNLFYRMSNAEFMFSKNFNPKVSCTFSRKSSSLVAPDSVTAVDLVEFARYEFDLTELYVRKLRQRMHEGKGTFSSTDFFKPMYDELHAEYTARITSAAKECDLGRKHEQLYPLHQEVLNEIAALPDYCKTCKPPKKKK